MSIIEKAMERARKDRAEGNVGSSASKTSESVSAPKQTSAMPTTTGTVEIAPQPHITQDKNEKNSPTNDFSENGQQVTINPIKELIMANDDTLAQGGSYRMLKEYILALRKAQPDQSLFMVTSAMRNEGKTLTSCNLACALALEFDTTVLLVDLDLRAPSCHRVFGLKNQKGLSDCLLHNTPIADCLIHTGIGKLSLLCAGSRIANPAELITSKRMQNFLLEVKHRYPDRIVILDSLPLLPFAESRALSRMADGVMLVVRENVTYKRHLENALQQLQDVPLLGMVYNGASTFGSDREIYNLSYYAYEDENDE